MDTVKERLEYLRREIENECISMAEIVELQGLADQIDPGDVLLLEWAGVPEFPVTTKRISLEIDVLAPDWTGISQIESILEGIEFDIREMGGGGRDNGEIIMAIWKSEEEFDPKG